MEGVFELPAGLLDEPELAELAERLPEGAEEIVLGRRVSASGRTSAFVAGPLRLGRRPAGCSAPGCSPSTASTSTAS